MSHLEMVAIFGKEATSVAFCLGVTAKTEGRQLNTNPFDPESESTQYEEFENGFAQATAKVNAR